MSRDGHDQHGLDVRPHHRPPGGEGVSGGTGRGGHHHAIAAEGGQRPSINLEGDLEHPFTGGLLHRHLVECPAPGEDLPVVGRRDVQGHPFLDDVVPGDNPLDGLDELLPLCFGQESYVPQVDPEQRSLGPPRQGGTAQDRAVTAKHTDQLTAPSRIRGVDRDDVRAPAQNGRLGCIGQQGNLKTCCMKLVRDIPGELLGFDPTWVGNEQDTAGHVGASVDKVAASSVTCAVVNPCSGRGVNHSRYSAFPVVPRMGLAHKALACRPAAVAAATTSSITRARLTADRTIPALPSRSRPTSNWGFTRSTRSPDGSTRSRRTGRTSRTEMKLRSATSSSAGPPRPPARASRMLRPERSITRGSPASSWASWPWPTSMATTSRAPCRNKTCVNPPAAAPTSKHLLSPALSPPGPNASNAATSLYAARLTQPSTPAASSRLWSTRTGVETFVAGDPASSPEPAFTRSRAWPGKRARPLVTSSTSSR